MLKKPFLYLFLLAFNFLSTFAQDQTIGKKNGAILSNVNGDSVPVRSKVLVIPFEPKMYMSEIDKEISEQNQLNFNQIRNRFRKSINDHIVFSISNKYNAFSLFNEEKEIQEDLKYVYYSIGYKYDEIPKITEENISEKKTDNSLNFISPNRLKKRNDPKNGIEKGEVISSPEIAERFMNTVISNPSLLEFLEKKYGAEIVVFVNQIDIKRATEGNIYALENDNFKREIKIHYSIIDIRGEQIDYGAAFSYFSGNTNDILAIINTNFPKLGQKITSKLTQPKAEEEFNSKQKNN